MFPSLWLRPFGVSLMTLSRGVETRWSLRSFSMQANLWFFVYLLIFIPLLGWKPEYLRQVLSPFLPPLHLSSIPSALHGAGDQGAACKSSVPLAVWLKCHSTCYCTAQCAKLVSTPDESILLSGLYVWFFLAVYFSAVSLASSISNPTCWGQKLSSCTRCTSAKHV